MSMRSRGSNGRFTSCPALASRRESLEKKRDRQRAYLFRRTRERKRISSTFISAFTVKGQNEAEHWIPGSKTDSLLFSCMESLIMDRFLEPRQSRLAIAKRIYFRGDSNSKRKRLPRISAWDADRPKKREKRVSAFVGWRFPDPTNVIEMDAVDSWLKKYEKKLRLVMGDATEFCFNLFSRYKKLTHRYMYIGYPLSHIPEVPAAPLCPLNNEQAPAHSDTRSNSNDNNIEKGSSIPDFEEPCIRQDALIEGYKEIMTVATKTDFYYRSLLLVLNPSCDVRLDVLCAAWMHQFTEKKPSDDWCGLLKDIFEYCLLVEQRDSTSEKFVQLREDLSNQLSMFKLIRQSAGLPLFEGSSSLIDQVFLRNRSI